MISMSGPDYESEGVELGHAAPPIANAQSDPERQPLARASDHRRDAGSRRLEFDLLGDV